MTTKLTHLACGLLLAAVAPRVWAAGQAPNYELVVPRIAAPNIDGDITDLSWTEASQKNGKIVIDLNNEAKFRVPLPRIAYLGYDQEALYLCIINFCADPAKLVAAGAGHFWNGDDMEVFIQPDLRNDGFTQVAVTPDGVVCGKDYDQVPRDRQLVRAASAKSDLRWMVELAIPYRFLGVPPPKPGDRWGLNLSGRQHGGASGWLSWNPTYGNFTDPQRFATIVFGK